jgi:glyoxylase-like metal-dependent hydrolase (beta-lactamase superfamily II)
MMLRTLIPAVLLAFASAGFAAETTDAAPDDSCTQPGWYVSSPWGFRTNSFWIAGDTGTVLVDTQFLPSAADELATRAARCTGKPVVAALVLHANPDKFNGTATLAARGVEVLTSQAVADAIPEVDALRRRWFEARYRPDYPERLVPPQVFGAASTYLERGGVGLNLHVLGGSVSKAHVVADWNGHLFVGDLVAHRHHAWLELGRIDDWITTLKYLQGLRPLRIYPGRGEPGGPELLTAQIDYLRTVKATVEAASPWGEIDEATLAALVENLTARYPGYGNPYFLELGLPAVWEALAAQRATKTPHAPERGTAAGHPGPAL